jgi:hypothetical protein
MHAQKISGHARLQIDAARKLARHLIFIRSNYFEVVPDSSPLQRSAAGAKSTRPRRGKVLDRRNHLVGGTSYSW